MRALVPVIYFVVLSVGVGLLVLAPVIAIILRRFFK